jgi:hypothetical protein
MDHLTNVVKDYFEFNSFPWRFLRYTRKRRKDFTRPLLVNSGSSVMSMQSFQCVPETSMVNSPDQYRISLNFMLQILWVDMLAHLGRVSNTGDIISILYRKHSFQFRVNLFTLFRCSDAVIGSGKEVLAVFGYVNNEVHDVTPVPV